MTHDLDTTEGKGQSSARRVADLTGQIELLDAEIERYRNLIESERVRHATELAEQQLQSDTRVDDVRRTNRIQTQALHDSYGQLLGERQVEFESALSLAGATHAEALAQAHRDHQQTLANERKRFKDLLEANRRHVADETNKVNLDTHQQLLNEVRQATGAIDRLESLLADYIERTRIAETRVQDASVEHKRLQQRHEQRIKHTEGRWQDKLADVEARLVLAEQRLAAERRKSAATVAEVLERSAALAAEADRARTEYGVERQRAEHDLVALAEAADERASRGLERESELESVIADLRARLGPDRP